MRTRTFTTTLAALALGGTAAAAMPVTTDAFGVSLGNNGTTLVTMADLNMPGALTGVPITAGGERVALSALAFRPQTGQLYGYSDQRDAVYLVDRATGVATIEVVSPGRHRGRDARLRLQQPGRRRPPGDQLGQELRLQPEIRSRDADPVHGPRLCGG